MATAQANFPEVPFEETAHGGRTLRKTPHGHLPEDEFELQQLQAADQP
jgi:hypothetical protein